MSVSWNGNNITGPILIYHQEISTSSFSLSSMIPSHALHCRSEIHPGVTWHKPSGAIVSTTRTTIFLKLFYQTKTSETAIPSVSVLASSTGINLNNPNGLWSCRLNGASVAVGLYFRGHRGGEC